MGAVHGIQFLGICQYAQSPEFDPQFFITHITYLSGMAVHTCNHRTWEAEVGGPGVQVQPV